MKPKTSTPRMLNTQHKDHSYLPPSNGAFALVVALGLMGFILLLLLSLVSFVRVESVAASTALAREEARQNALLSMNIAFGEIQRNLGVDQRSSARAEIMDTAPDDGLTVDGVLNPFWTGVWDNNGNLLTWLVSGNRSDGPLEWDALSSNMSADTDNTVLAVAPGSSGNGEVRVPLRPVGNSSGRFGYWVSDEGVKAKINLVGSDSTQPNASLLSSQRMGVQLMNNLSWFPKNDPLSIRRLHTLDSMAMLADNPDPAAIMPLLRSQFHDISFHSKGVLSDARNGGLRRDLTLGLYESGSSNPEGDIFPPVSSAFPLPQDPGGPAWAQVRSWLNTNLSSGNLPVRQSSNSEAGFFPVVSSVRVYMLPTYDPDTLQVNVHLMPSVVLWNPYDTPLETADYSIRMGRTNQGGSFTFQRDIFYFTGHAGGPPTNPASGGTTHGWVIQLRNNPSSESIENSPLWNRFEPLVFHLPNVQIGPGESMVFSPPAGQHNRFFWPSEGGMSLSANQLFPGFRPEWSYYYPLPLNHQRLVLDADGEKWQGYNEYILYQATQSRIMSVNFSLGAAANASHLMDIVHLTTQNPVTPPVHEMIAFAETIPFADTYREAAPGLFFQRKYTDNSLVVAPDRLRARKQWLTHTNPRGATQGSNPFYFTLPQGGTYGYNTNPSNNPSFIGFADRFNDNQGIVEFPGNRVPVGLSETSSITRAILFESPPARDQLHSIGQLQHAPLYRFSPDWQTLTNDQSQLGERMRRGRYDNLVPTYAVGNSAANPRIPLGSSAVQWPTPSSTGAEGANWTAIGWHYDYSYLLNDNLWDSYFFSTLPENFDPILPTLANQRLQVIPQDPNETPFGYSTSAANLLVDGAFNVNSTSFEAWSALLASFWGEDVTRANGTVESNSTQSPFLRNRLPMGGVSSDGSPSTPAVYDGYRALTQSQITALASEIVRQVKLRGPFTSLAQFVNRSLTGDNELRRSGALASALARANTNDTLKVNAFRAVTTDDAFPGGVNGIDAASEAGWRTSNLPGWLSQADLLSRLGSVINTRSDTFVIRAYGESNNPVSGAVRSRAWVEAVVQRMPYYIENSLSTNGDLPQTRPDDLINSINQVFGRQFKIVSFRWLDDDDL